LLNASRIFVCNETHLPIKFSEGYLGWTHEVPEEDHYGWNSWTTDFIHHVVIRYETTPDHYEKANNCLSGSLGSLLGNYGKDNQIRQYTILVTERPSAKVRKGRSPIRCTLKRIARIDDPDRDNCQVLAVTQKQAARLHHSGA
jgi:hypothetical protein